MQGVNYIYYVCKLTKYFRQLLLDICVYKDCDCHDRVEIVG